MRILGAFFAVGLLVTPVFAQKSNEGGRIIPNPGGGEGSGKGARLGDPATPALDPKNVPLDAHLLQWENKTRSFESVWIQTLTRTDKDATGKSAKVWKGEARFLRPNLAAFRIELAGDPNMVEMMISTGNFLYEYRPQFKKLVIHELPKREAGFDNNLLTFLFGMNAAEAKRRYELVLAKDVSEKNPHGIFIEVNPRLEADKREFTKAQIVLDAATMVPSRLWFLHANSSEVTWDLQNVSTDSKLRPSDFRAIDPPKGWDTVRVPLQELPAAGAPARPPVSRPADRR